MKHEIQLSTEVSWCLSHLAKGARIESRRTFPHPHHFALIRPPNAKRKETTEKQYAKELADITIDTLVRRRLVTATPKDALADVIVYRIAPDGEAAASRGGVIVYDDEATDWVDVSHAA